MVDYTGISQLLFWLYCNSEFDFHRFMCSVLSSHSNRMTVTNWGKILILLFSIWRLSLHHFVFSCSHMWLMVVLCMVTAFLLRCTWVLLCTDMAAEVCSYFCSVLFLTKSTRTAESWTAVDVFTWKQRRWRLSPNTHARSRSVTYVLRLLISCCLFFGPCLESQCALCGEPEGEWASPFPESSCRHHHPACCLLL